MERKEEVGFGFTPGPWSAENIIVCDVTGIKVADCRNYGLPLQELPNNARLIAAAPEMLGAIIQAVEWIEDDRFGDDYIMEDWYHQMKCILDGFRK
jgi:hypothetical protein